MAVDFPTTPRTPLVVRVAAVVVIVAAGALATRVTITSTAWVGRVFPGFFLLDNGVVASIGLPHWTGAQVPDLYWRQVVAVDGTAVTRAADVYNRVATLSPGTQVSYSLRVGDGERSISIATQRFTLSEWFLLFAPYLLSGAAFLTSGLVAWVLRPTAPIARALLLLGLAWGTMMFTALDLYGPGTFFRLYALAETMMPAALLQLALLFPEPHRWARWRFLGYIPAVLVVFVYELLLYAAPGNARLILYLNLIALALVAVAFTGRLVAGSFARRSELARRRTHVVTIGGTFGFAIPAAIGVASAALGGGIGMNFATITNPAFALALAYAIIKHDLFEIDAMVKRGAYYLVLTGVVAVAYLAAVVVFDRVLRTGTITDSPLFPVVFALAVLLVLDPLRTRLQAVVDRLFFRTGYDAARIIASVGQELTASLDQQQIASLVRMGVEEAIPGSHAQLFVNAANGMQSDGHRQRVIPTILSDRLATGAVVTAFDPVEIYQSRREHESVRTALSDIGAEVAIAARLRGKLMGVLTVGSKRSGLFYTAGDAEFLRALAHQAAIALENARTYATVATLNARLEESVQDRTAALEAANTRLSRTYAELKAAEVQLVHTEKMASLGRLVAGVAHEINNPVSFIVANVAPLRRRLAVAAAKVPVGGQALLHEAQEIASIMARGAERTAAIVQDLRSFSRVGEATLKPSDVHDGLETSLRLLGPRWRDRITIHRDYGSLPLVECDPSQLNQVFTNLLANACDAVPERGNVWLETRAAPDAVTLTIRDDGPGIPPGVIGRIFDPFFTTKEVGSGTGLGLAISQSIVAAHGGRLEAESPAGGGAIFRVTIPIVARPAADRMAAVG